MATQSMSTAAVNRLVEKNERLEKKAQKERVESRATEQKVVGMLTAVASAGVAGYIDGRYDIAGKDQTAGDGLRVMGAPVVPITGLAVGAFGVWVGGDMGNALLFSGLGMACGSVYGAAETKGFEQYQKKMAEAAAARGAPTT